MGQRYYIKMYPLSSYSGFTFCFCCLISYDMTIIVFIPWLMPVYTVQCYTYYLFPALLNYIWRRKSILSARGLCMWGNPPPPHPPHSEGKYSGGKNGHRFPPGEGNSFSLLQVNPSWIIPLDDVILAAVGCSYTAPINSIGWFTNRVPWFGKIK